MFHVFHSLQSDVVSGIIYFLEYSMPDLKAFLVNILWPAQCSLSRLLNTDWSIGHIRVAITSVSKRVTTLHDHCLANPIRLYASTRFETKVKKQLGNCLFKFQARQPSARLFLISSFVRPTLTVNTRALGTGFPYWLLWLVSVAVI